MPQAGWPKMLRKKKKAIARGYCEPCAVTTCMRSRFSLRTIPSSPAYVED